MKTSISPKSFWYHVRRKLKSKESVAPLYERPDDKLSIKHSDKEKANILQKQFSGVFTIEPEGQLPRFDTRTRSSIPEVNIPAEMVSKKIKALDKNNACGLNGINLAYCESLLTMFRSRSQKYSINPLRIRCFLRTGKQR